MKNNNNPLGVNQQEKINSLVQDENYKFWLGGFAEGEGALVISVVKNGKVARGIVLQPEFNVAQHENGLNILYSFKALFANLGHVVKKSGSSPLRYPKSVIRISPNRGIYMKTTSINFSARRNYSTGSFVPAVTYDNFLENKKQIIKENFRRSGIYLFTNLINGKQYVGSSVNLSKRFYLYFDETAMKSELKRSKSYIYSAMLKHGLQNFSLIILEYCEVEKCNEKEKYYIKILSPEYNIVQDPTASPMLGRKHSPETRELISSLLQNITHSGRFKKGREKTGGSGKPPLRVEVFDLETNETTTYSSISEAARALNIPSDMAIYYSIKIGKAYKKRYIFKKLD